MKGVSFVKKSFYLLGLIILMAVSGYAISSYRASQIYLTDGSYQGEVLNEKEGQVGLYTLNVGEENVTLFSSMFNESFEGTTNNSDPKEYDFAFEGFNIPGVMLSDNEIQLFIDEEPYVFRKKSDVPIWEVES